MKIYTRTGDKGKTSLVNGTRVSKASGRVDTYGTVDELNSVIGAVVAHLGASQGGIKQELEEIQHDLFMIGAELATPVKNGSRSASSGPSKRQMSKGSGESAITGANGKLKKRVDEFEKTIDKLTKELPELKTFILPGGGEAGSLLHLARTVCRRAERRIVALSKKEQIDEAIRTYFNRLSDLLFTYARFVNLKEKKKETVWSKR